jgi:DNA-binding transcriptional MerR regulator
VTSSARFLNPSEAASRLGVSIKALRLYEQHGFVVPSRSAAGWRAYGTAEMERAGEIVALRALGLSLAQVARVLDGDRRTLEPALAAHQTALEGKLRALAGTVEKVRGLRADLVQGKAPGTGDLARLLAPIEALRVAFDLPWPWGGERFELRDIRKLTFIVGPLGSGKTRLAIRLAETLPHAMFIGLDRLVDRERLEADPVLQARVDRALTLLVEDGAMLSDALSALVVALEANAAAVLVIDMVEQGLDLATQEAVSAHLLRRAPDAPPLLLLTRSSAILDLAAVGDDVAIILCPANHSPPSRVAPYPGSPGYEAVATCLASPDVRARTEGTIAWRPKQAR